MVLDQLKEKARSAIGSGNTYEDDRRFDSYDEAQDALASGLEDGDLSKAERAYQSIEQHDDLDRLRDTDLQDRYREIEDASDTLSEVYDGSIASSASVAKATRAAITDDRYADDHDVRDAVSTLMDTYDIENDRQRRVLVNEVREQAQQNPDSVYMAADVLHKVGEIDDETYENMQTPWASVDAEEIGEKGRDAIVEKLDDDPERAGTLAAFFGYTNDRELRQQVDDRLEELTAGRSHEQEQAAALASAFGEEGYLQRTVRNQLKAGPEEEQVTISNQDIATYQEHGINPLASFSDSELAEVASSDTYQLDEGARKRVSEEARERVEDGEIDGYALRQLAEAIDIDRSDAIEDQIDTSLDQGDFSQAKLLTELTGTDFETYVRQRIEDQIDAGEYENAATIAGELDIDVTAYAEEPVQEYRNQGKDDRADELAARFGLQQGQEKTTETEEHPAEPAGGADIYIVGEQHVQDEYNQQAARRLVTLLDEQRPEYMLAEYLGEEAGTDAQELIADIANLEEHDHEDLEYTVHAFSNMVQELQSRGEQIDVRGIDDQEVKSVLQEAVRRMGEAYQSGDMDTYKELEEGVFEKKEQLNAKREQTMVERISETVDDGETAVISMGADHVEPVQNALEEQGYIVDAEQFQEDGGISKEKALEFGKRQFDYEQEE